MSEIWPLDVKERETRSPEEGIKPFKCLLLMPIGSGFDDVTRIIKTVVDDHVERLFPFIQTESPIVERLDWVISSRIIQQEIWEKIVSSDLIFCDITGYNPNVMFECGVCAAWKDVEKVAFIKDYFFRQESAFDIAPKRYVEYQMTSQGRPKFIEKVEKLVDRVLIQYPNRQVKSVEVTLPLEIDFNQGQDNNVIYTPPVSHRRVVEGRLEFGSPLIFGHSWASIGKKKFHNFQLEFEGKFNNVVDKGEAWLGVGLRSQHWAPGFAHILYLRANGMIRIAEPNDDSPALFRDNMLRDATQIDTGKDHLFRVSFDDRVLKVEVDGFSDCFEVRKMSKVYKCGMIRLQTYRCRMALRKLKLGEFHSE